MAESLRDAVLSGAPLAGTVLTLPGVAVAELLSEPFDLVWVDLEHGALGARDAQEMIIGAQAAGAYAMVRLPADAQGLMVPALDGGVDGVVIADVRDPAVAEAVVRRVVHPPEGTRGWGPRRLALRGRGERRPASPPSIWVQAESAEAVERAGEIAAVAGVDAVCVGLADLSVALGAPLRMDSPALAEAVATVAAACRAAGTALALAGPLDGAPAELLAHASILVHGTDAKLCARAVDAAAAWIHGTLEPGGRNAR
ncbi:MAG: aldolase/citrate lyase family protein [Solirubrobacterales bacterium]